jgi:endonuclease/exonuclease/phosphatase family metal-dependent hydrolase
MINRRFTKLNWSPRLRLTGWIILAIGCAGTRADEPRTISFITYNVQFLPPPASFANKRPNPDYRAERIAEETSKFDVVSLQEVFHLKHRDQIVAGLTEAWKETPNTLIAPRPQGFTANGGTALLTRLPILVTNTTVYKNFSKPEDYGLRADGFAAKGVIHGRIAMADDNLDSTIDVYITHLEARDDELRPKQYAELAAFIKKTSSPNRPMVLVGDMNTRGMIEYRNDPESQYSQLIKELNRARPNGGVVDVWTELRGDELGGTSEQESSEIGKRIDYIFVGNPDSAGPKLVPKSIEVKTYQDEKVTALSDHNAVVAEFVWKE